MKRLTLEDIGKLAGVSRATVSRVVNNHPNISPEVRQRVQNIIEETGYQPNLAARQLASNRSDIIGLVIPNSVQSLFMDPYFARLIQGIAQACNANDQTLSLFLIEDNDDEKRMFKRLLGNGLLDGLVFAAVGKNDSFLPQLQSSTMTFILVGRFENMDGIPYIDADNVHGAAAATEHLIGMGYQRIAMVGSGKNNAGAERYEGYRQALVTRNRAPDANLYAMGDFTQVSGYETLQTLLPHNPDAVFAASDEMAVGAIRAIEEAGLRVPEDIAVVGFDDVPTAVAIAPQLTTIRQPIQEMGALATETLLEIISGDITEPQQTILDTALIIRESCGAAQRNNS
ncbi:MAG: LacI family DNA-binding transcriptional regulator [Chloroflexota bacterium]